MLINLDVDNIENVDNDDFCIILLITIIKKDTINMMKLLPFLTKMSENKIKNIWMKTKRFLDVDDKKWFKSLIKDF
jgi:hypothetical protein